MLARVGFILLAMTAGFYAWARDTGFALKIPADQAITAEFSAKADPRRVLRSIESAVARDDAGEAQMYRIVAQRMGLAVAVTAIDTVRDEAPPASRSERAAAEFGAAVVTGLGESEAALAGAMSVAGSVAGDIRDVVLEGTKAGAGNTYDHVILGLSVAGLKKDADAKAAALWKVAHRNSLLQPEMQTALTVALGKAVPVDDVKGALSGVNFADLTAAQSALAPVAAKVDLTKLEPFLSAAAVLTQKLGDAEAVKVASLAKSPEDLRDLADLSAELGMLTRAAVELTDVRKVSDLKTTVTIEEAVQINPVPVALWTAVLLAMMALGDFRLFGPLPRSKPAPAKRMFRRMPERQLHSLDGDTDA